MVDILKVRERAKKKKEEESAKKSRTKRASAAKKRGRKSSTRKKKASKKKKSSRKKAAKATPAKKKRTAAKKKTSVAKKKKKKQKKADGAPEPRAEISPPRPDEEMEEIETTGKGIARLEEYKETAGILEDQDLRMVGEEEEEIRGDEILTFVIAGEHYAIDVGDLVEIIVPRPVTEVPNSPDEVAGLISLRGTIVTLVDLRRLLDLPLEIEETLDSRVVVVRDGNDMIGFHVDRVTRVSIASENEIEPNPAVAESEMNPLLRGVFSQNEELVGLLDLTRIADAATREMTV